MISGTTSNIQGGTTGVEHGIANAGKIIGWTSRVYTSDFTYAPPNFPFYEIGYYVYLGSAANFWVINSATGSGSGKILSRPITITLWYIE